MKECQAIMANLQVSDEVFSLLLSHPSHTGSGGALQSASTIVTSRFGVQEEDEDGDMEETPSPAQRKESFSRYCRDPHAAVYPVHRAPSTFSSQRIGFYAITFRG